MLWLNANREKIKSDHPGISITDLSKKAGEIWKGMSKEKKEVSDSRDTSGGHLLRNRTGSCRFCFESFSLFALVSCVCVDVPMNQEWDRKAEDARREYEKAMKEYEGGRGESSKR